MITTVTPRVPASKGYTILRHGWVSKRALVQSHDGPVTGPRFDGHNVKAARRLADAPIGQELASHAGEVAALVVGYRILRQAAHTVFTVARFHLDKRQHVPIVTNQIDFAVERRAR